MKKNAIRKVLLLIGCLFCLSACGSEGVGNSGETEAGEGYMDLEVQEEDLGFAVGMNSTKMLFGTQFYKGEAVRIFGEKQETTEGEERMNVYLTRSDESSEVLFEGLSMDYRGSWFLDMAGNVYCMSGVTLTKINKDGTIAYSRIMDSAIRDICQLNGGSIMLLVEKENGTIRMAQLNAKDGTVTEKTNVELGEGAGQFIGPGPDGPVVMDKDGLWSVIVSEGSREKLIDFTETAYVLDISLMDFYVTQEGQVQLLYNGRMETLQVKELAEEKKVITLCNYNVIDTIKSYVADFNKQNDEYVIKIEEADRGISLADYRTRTQLEVASGKGADIIGLNALNSIGSLIEKGALLDVKPYMEASGIHEEDYFPQAFNCWKTDEKIYCIIYKATAGALWMDESLLGDAEELDIETVVDALLAASQETFFTSYYDSVGILNYFLTATETFFGMIDREQGICDFSGELFAKLLQVAKIHGYDKKHNYPVLAGSARANGFYRWDTQESLASEGKRRVGYFFDDGCYPAYYDSNGFVINANSQNAEGAWAFLEFMLSEEFQSKEYDLGYPVHKGAFDARVAQEIEEGAWIPGKTKAGDSEYLRTQGLDAYKALYDLTPEKAAEIKAYLEAARPRAFYMGPIRSIVLEEAEAYFSGVKTIEEIVPIIENRVQLYLDEQN